MKDNKPLVSFILTNYNLPVAMLCECIESILALSLRPYEREIIIIDDGSEESPMNELMRYGEDIIYVRHKNQGVSVARNTGMRIAQGDFIQIIDGDDILLTTAYERCLDVVRYQSDAEVVAFDFIDDKSKEQSVCEFKKTSGIELLRDRNIRGAVWCYLFKRKVCSALSFTPGRKYAEDEEFVAQLLLRTEDLYITDAPAYLYRKREESAVHKKDKGSIQKRLNDTHDVILHLYNLIDKLPIDGQQAMQRRVAQLSMDYIYNIIKYTHSRQEMDKRIGQLENEGLFPLPQKEYTKKYKWFCKMVSTQLGRHLLLHSLPYIKKER